MIESMAFPMQEGPILAVATSDESAQEAVANVSFACDAKRPPSPLLFFIYLLWQDSLASIFPQSFHPMASHLHSGPV